MTVREGDTGPDISYGPIELPDLVRYAGASNDFNPLHYDPSFASSAGQPTIIAQGMLSAGLLASFLTLWFGPDSVRRFKVRFGEPVRPGDILKPQGKVMRVYDENGTNLGDVELWMARQDGINPLTGNATVWLTNL